MFAFLKARKEEITALAAMLGVVIGVFGFGLTWYQLARTTRTLQASNTYQVQKDGRELLDKILADAEFRGAITGTTTPKDEPLVLDNIWRMLNFYLSVHRQAEAGGLSPDVIDSFKDDFCGFVRLPKMMDYWNMLTASHRIGQSQEIMRQKWCKNV